MLRKIFKWALIVVAVLFILSLLGEDNTTNKDVDTSVITYESPETLDPQPRGKRTLGIGISDGSIGFNAAFMIAKEAGAEVVEIPTFWDEIETSPGAFSGGWLPVADAFYPQSNTKISISLNAVDTNKLRLPDDLKDRPFNDPEVIKRYKEFVSFAATQVPNSEVYFVSVGNEVDIYLGNSNKKWQEYSDSGGSSLNLQTLKNFLPGTINGWVWISLIPMVWCLNPIQSRPTVVRCGRRLKPTPIILTRANNPICST